MNNIPQYPMDSVETKKSRRFYPNGQLHIEPRLRFFLNASTIRSLKDCVPSFVRLVSLRMSFGSFSPSRSRKWRFRIVHLYRLLGRVMTSGCSPSQSSLNRWVSICSFSLFHLMPADSSLSLKSNLSLCGLVSGAIKSFSIKVGKISFMTASRSPAYLSKPNNSSL